MLVSQKQRKPPAIARLLTWTRMSKTQAAEQEILSEEAFRFELQKERSRVDRRLVKSRFCVILVGGLGLKQLGARPEVILSLRDRLRITDLIGWFENKLAILLPETDRAGALFVVDELDTISDFYELEFGCEICVYPDDDNLASHSSEYLDATESKSYRIDGPMACVAAASIQDGHHFPSATQPTPIWKRLIDIVGSSVGLVVLAPVLGVAAVAIKLSSSGPVFFRQKREGRNGETFEILKFRTMCTDAEQMKSRLLEFSEQDGPAFKLKNDPRLTRVGKYLRKSCIDELPQLINVLRGEMSLVGPRPLPVNESVECSIWQRKRLEVAPGLTCIWQVQGDRNTKFSDWMRMDMEYIRRRSLWFDLKLIFQTILVAVLHRGSV